MTIDKIARCSECANLDFCNRAGKCEWCCETSELVYSTGMIAAATRPVDTETSSEEAA